MKLLAVDTSTDACSAALVLDNTFLERFEIASRTHTQLLLPMIDSLLKEAGIALSELDAFSFGCGPGSFTGLRIATAIIQGLSFGTGKPVIPISTLRALAQGAYRETQNKQVMAWLDARLQQIYWGLYRVDEQGIMQSATIEHVQDPLTIVLPEGDWHKITGFPKARDIALIAVTEYKLGHMVSAEAAQPVYIRDDIVRK